MMPSNQIELFPWNTNFETGIPVIDEQHRNLFSLINKLANALVYDNQLQVSTIFDELADYARYHFSEEEHVWQQYFEHDSWCQLHKANHESFLPEILNLQSRTKESGWHEATEQILHFLIRWLLLHILHEDKKMGLVLSALSDGAIDLQQAKIAAEAKLIDEHGTLTDTILNMYFELSSHAIELIREKNRRIIAEKELKALNDKLQKLAVTDELSGLFNRRYFMMMTPETLLRAKVENSKLSFISLDLDNFKHLNDTLGHVKGDEAIVQFSRVLSSKFCRESDYIFRMGGDEFLVVVCGSEHKQVMEIAEQVRSAIESLTSNDAAEISAITTSIGVFTHIPEGYEDFMYFMERADQLLYQAKEQGRNRILSVEE
ncbi:putative diguanylate cyclase YdaM [Vibrio thalassae]|uniref:diguanylate cyclase n=1 Tax=Vibrio thalassae TaxID=1243014 RepID=A0A240EIK3_9VIBR|nr:bacteriohemerythrin [Vibrio thalassae]SNX48416.1 putative diguanylate cyclase YdaM [Vibrio thalassae]